VDIEDSSDIFDRSRTPRRPLSLPSGATNFDPLNDRSSIDDRYSQPLSRVAAARDADEFTDCYYEPQEQDYSRWEHAGSQYEIPHEDPPIPSVEREGKTPVQVEVYPGHFLPLRGAKETIEAIERGLSKYVFCYGCGLGLRCVADCELVICPECRIMSPALPCRPASFSKETECEDQDNFSHRHDPGSLPQFNSLWSDESFHSRNGSSVGSTTGGVGLGLSMEN
jgi:hypothetical protein